jgi:hypothetical protein
MALARLGYRPLGDVRQADGNDAVGSHPGDRHAGERDVPGGRTEQSRDRTQERALARAVAADERDHLSRPYFERDLFEDPDRPVPDVNPVHREQRIVRPRDRLVHACVPR